MDTGFSLLALFTMGGVFMWPLLAFSIAAVALVIERTAYLCYHNLHVDDLEQSVRTYFAANDIAGACEYLRALTKKRIGARVLLALAQSAHMDEHRLEKAVEVEAVTSINTLENGCDFLTAIASLAPLTGFLGTVSGMIGAFKSIAEATEVNAQIVANGIYEALITTVFGLIIAIVAITAHSIITHVIDRFAANAERTCSILIAELSKKAQK
ncbi:MAG: MotA/TolQ/ExbB proton channel family protein [Treponemataceae bacterium]|nr:MAG: MotA/TolQ/ExbB proton channel family protein [Treponemataceae bacterium]